MVSQVRSKNNPTPGGRLPRFIAAMLVFAIAISVDSWNGHLGSTDAATPEPAPIVITTEEFNPEALPLTAFGD